MTSKIEYTDETWPVVTGCTPVSKGCMNCWAARLAAGRLKNHPHYKELAIPGDPPRWTGEIRLNEDILDKPHRWKKKRRVFVAPTGDLFHPDVPLDFIQSVFLRMKHNPLHTFQVLTKRADRMREIVTGLSGLTGLLPNVWLGVTVERQEEANNRLPHLAAIDWPVKWVSLEPLLGPVDHRILWEMNWIVIGGESGKHARPMHPDWPTRITKCCGGTIPIFFKQWGEWLPWGSGDYTRVWINSTGKVYQFEGPPPVAGSVMMTRTGKKRAGNLLDGKKWEEIPE